MEKCPICNQDETEWRRIAKSRAIKTAHSLAIKKADEGIEGLEWEEVYAIYFPKIFKHEHKRNLQYERELELDRLVKKYYYYPDPNICSYHQENLGWYGDGMHSKTLKRTCTEYSNTKWPNPLKPYPSSY